MVLLLLALGCVVLAGWEVGSRALTEVLPGRAAMKVNTAVCFLLMGLGLGAQKLKLRVGVKVLVGLVFAVGAVTLLEFATRMNLRLDDVLVHDPWQAILPGRMSWVSAMNFCLGAVALWVLTLPRRWWRWAYTCVVLMLVSSVTSIVGYLYGVTVLYGATEQDGAHSMALHTGVGFVVLGVGLLLVEGDSRFYRLMTGHEVGSVLTRRALLFVVVVPVLLGWLYLRPGLDYGGPRFGLAVFASTLVTLAVAGLLVVSFALNREARGRAASAATVARNERELQLVTDNLPTLISYLDAEWRFVRVNRTYAAWGTKARKGVSIRAAMGDAYWAKTEGWRERAAAGETVCFEAEYPREEGLRRVMVTYAPDVDRESNRVRGYACMVQDVHEQRQAETALRQSEKLAVVGRLASSIAHEINNPLESVTNLLYLIGQETASVQPVSEYVTMAQSELERVTQIVVQTLRFHRQATDQRACRVSELTRQVLTLYHGRLAGAGITVVQDFARERELTCWEGEVRQVLANLVGNSVDAMRQGGVLTMRARAYGAGVMVTAADTGGGMKPETLAKLFEPFYTTKGATGSGLGLWISQEIVERHGGRIKVRSALGRGTVFQIYLPQG